MNKMMSLAKKYVTGHKLRSGIIVLILSIAFASYIIISSASAVLKDVTIQNAADESGGQHFAYKFPSDDEYRKLKEDPAVSEIGAESYIGTTQYGENELLLVHRDENYSKLDSTLDVNEEQEGRKPQAINEIALSSDYLEYMGKSIGDKVMLEYEKVNFGNGELVYSDSGEFTITGSFANSADGKINNMYFGLVSEALLDQYGDSVKVERALVKLKEERNIESQVKNLIQSLELKSEISLNQNLINALGDTDTMRRVNVIINLVVAFFMGLAVYNVLYFNFVHKSRDLGIMRGIGFNGYELSTVVFMEVAFYLILSMPIGMLLGTAFNSLFLERMITGIVDLPENSAARTASVNQLRIAGEAVALLLLTIVPSVAKPLIMTFRISPMEVVRRGRSDIEVKFSRLSLFAGKRLKNTLTVYALKNLSRNRKRTLITISSLAITVMLTSAMIMLTSITSIDPSFIKEYFVPGDIKVEVQGLNAFGAEKTFSEKTLEDIKNLDGVEEINAYKITGLYTASEVATIKANSEASHIFDREIDEGFKYNIARYNGEDFLGYNITAFGVENIEEYAEDTKGISVVVDREYADSIGAEIGDEIMLFEFGEKSIDESIGSAKTATIGAIADELPVWNETGHGTVSIMMGISDMNSIIGDKGYERFDIWVSNGTDLKTVLELEAMADIQDYGMVATYSEKEEIYLESVKSRKITQLIFNIVFIGVAMIGLFNTITTSLMNRDREIMTLYAIGITESEIRKSVVFEGSLYSLISVIVALPVQVLLGIVSVTQFESNIILSFLGLNIGLIVVGGIFSQYIYSKAFKSKRIEVLKVE